MAKPPTDAEFEAKRKALGEAALAKLRAIGGSEDEITAGRNKPRKFKQSLRKSKQN